MRTKRKEEAKGRCRATVDLEHATALTDGNESGGQRGTRSWGRTPPPLTRS